MKDEAAIRAKFEQFDAEGNGHIDEAKFTGLVRKLGLKMTDAKAAKAFRSLDSSGEGQVDFDGFCAWWFKYDRP